MERIPPSGRSKERMSVPSWLVTSFQPLITKMWIRVVENRVLRLRNVWIHNLTQHKWIHVFPVVGCFFFSTQTHSVCVCAFSHVVTQTSALCDPRNLRLLLFFFLKTSCEVPYSSTECKKVCNWLWLGPSRVTASQMISAFGCTTHHWRLTLTTLTKLGSASGEGPYELKKKKIENVIKATFTKSHF